MHPRGIASKEALARDKVKMLGLMTQGVRVTIAPWLVIPRPEMKK